MPRVQPVRPVNKWPIVPYVSRPPANALCSPQLARPLGVLASQLVSRRWRASSAANVETPPLTADADADHVIIGGGFTGNAAALEAARRGASVIVLEADTIGHGGSGRNVGLVNAGLWLPPHDGVAQMGQEAGLKLIGLLADAPKLVWSLIERENIDCEATPNGTLHLAHSAAGLRNLEERHRQGVELGAPVHLFDAAETARRTGPRIPRLTLRSARRHHSAAVLRERPCMRRDPRRRA